MPSWILQLALTLIQAAPQEIALIKAILDAVHPSVAPAHTSLIKGAVDAAHAVEPDKFAALKQAIDRLQVKT